MKGPSAAPSLKSFLSTQIRLPFFGQRSDAAKADENALPLRNSPFWLSAGIMGMCGVVGSLLPMLPVYLRERGIGAEGFAFISAAQHLTALLIGQFIGYLADTKIRRTTMVSFMAFGGMISAAIFPMLPTNIIALSLGMVVLSFFLSQRISIFNSLILDSERGEELYPQIRAWGSVGFVIIAPIVGFLAGLPFLGSWVMWPTIIVLEIVIILTLLKLTDAPAAVRIGRQGGHISFLKAQRLLLGNPVILWFLIFVFLTQSIHLPGHFFQLLLLDHLQVSPLVISLSVTWAAICEILIFVYGPQIVRRFDMMFLLPIAALALAVRFLLIFTFHDSPLIIFATNTLHMFTFGLAYLCSVILMNREAPAELKSSGQALIHLVFLTLAALLGNLASMGVFRLLHMAGLDDRMAIVYWFGLSVAYLFLAMLSLIPLTRAYRKKHRFGGMK